YGNEVVFIDDVIKLGETQDDAIANEIRVDNLVTSRVPRHAIDQAHVSTLLRAKP
ncbi:unnamed protein product, partial [Sphenostylis stenocarpa]